MRFIKEFQPVVERSAEEKVKKKAREGRIINNGVTSFLVKSKVLLQILIKKDNQLGISKPADSILSRSCGKIRSLKNFIKSFDSL